MGRHILVEAFSIVQKAIIWVIPVIFAITVHEVAHGWAALQLGDRTAQILGRLTLNPVKHVDLIGTVLVPGLLFLMGGLIFGWAKPVPVTQQNLRKPKSDMIWVALAGPLANLIMAVIWAFMVKLGMNVYQHGIAIGEPMVYMGIAGVLINTMLMLFNLLPLPPLDGGQILVSALPDRLGWQISRVEPYGFFILLALLYFGVISAVLLPLMNTCIGMLAMVAGLPPLLFSIL